MTRIKEETPVGPRPGPVEFGKARPPPPSPEEGRRLVVAFMGIRNAAVRDAIVNLIERMSRNDNDLK